MATIQSSIKLTDGMTPALQSMNKALGLVISSFESMQKVSGKSIDTASLRTARQEIAKAQVAMNGVEQEIIQAKNAQNNFNNKVKQGSGAVTNLWGKVKGLVAAYVGFQGITKTLSLADEMSSLGTRLDFINDGMQTTKELQDKIYQSAMRSRGAYLDTANAVVKLSNNAKDAFSSNDETIKFAETLNKMFVVGGVKAQEASAAMLQLTQALGSGVLQGDELRSIGEQAPVILNTIADSMGVTRGELKKLGSEGKVTAAEIKKAILGASTDIEKKFKKMPLQWGQAWTMMKNFALRQFEPILAKISKVVQTDKFTKFSNAVGNAIQGIIKIAGHLFDAIIAIVNFIYDNWGPIETVLSVMFSLLNDVYNAAKWVAQVFVDNWSLIEPIIWGITSALIVLKGPAVLGAFLSKISWIGKLFVGAWGVIKAFGVFFTVLFSKGLTGAVAAFGKAMGAALGITLGGFASWALLIIGVLFGLWFIIEVINKICGTSISFLGIICAIFATIWMLIWNTGAISWNICMFIIQLAATVVNSILALVWNLIAVILNAISSAVQFIVNCCLWVYDNFGIMCDNVGIAWDNMCANLKVAFYGAISACLDMLASLLDSLSGIPFIGDKFAGWSSSLKSSAKGYDDKANKTISSKQSYKSLKSFGSIDTEVYKYANPLDMGKYTWNTLNDSLPYASLKGFGGIKDAYNYGKDFKFSDLKLGGSKGFNLDDLNQTLIPTDLGYTPIPTDTKDLGYTKIPTGSGSAGKGLNDLGNAIGNAINGGKGSGIGNTLDKIANNTGKIAGDTSDLVASEQDISYMRDLAEQEAINRYTMTDLKIEMNNNNNINSDMDLDKVVDYLQKKVYEGVLSSAEGVHF